MDDIAIDPTLTIGGRLCHGDDCAYLGVCSTCHCNDRENIMKLTGSANPKKVISIAMMVLCFLLPLFNSQIILV